MLPFRVFGFLSTVVLVAVLGGCGSRGVAEFQLYTQAFNSQYEQGDAVLNTVARAERAVVLRRIRQRAIPDFDPEQAAYFLDSVDPPITASIRASLKSLKSYNDALGGLANGEAAEALTNRIGTLSTNVIGAIAATQGALAGAGAIPGAANLVSQAGQALTLAAPIIKQVATFASRAAFRQQLIATYPYMKDLMLTLRSGTPAMFEIIKRSRVTRGSLDNGSGISAEGQAALEKDRAMLAAWVVVLDKSLEAMEAAVVAAMSDTPDVDLASLSEASIELRVLAEQIKSLRSK